MLSLFLAVKIIYVLNATIPCNAPFEILACNIPQTNTIYIKDPINDAKPQDFILYHELGHQLNFTAPIGIFKNHAEVLADSFAMWIYNHKYPILSPKIEGERKKYFESVCDKKCVDTLIAMRVPHMVYPITSFEISQ